MIRNILRMRQFNTVLRLDVPQLAKWERQSRRLLSGIKLDETDAEENTNKTKNYKNPFASEGRRLGRSTNGPTSTQTSADVNTQSSNPFASNPSKFNEEEVSEEISDGERASCELTPEEKEKRLKVLQLEADIAHQEGRRVPELSFFQDSHWEHVLTLPTRSARSKYYAYLWQISMKKEAKERKKEQRANAILEIKEMQKKEREENTHIIYGLAHTTFFLRIYDSTINHWQNNRLTRAMQFSPKIVLDCSYDQHMTTREALNAAKQLTLCFAENRAHDDPFDLHYCNVNLRSTCMQSLQRHIPTMMNPEFPMNVHEKCFTEVFPKENLVYLTPHCRNDLEQYNPDDVYIVGAMVDTVNNEPLSLAKAKKLGIRMARLPLDRYLSWGSGSGKSLTLNQMVKIMLDLKMTGDWERALKHVPRRKIADWQMEHKQEFRSAHNRAEKLNVRIDQVMRFDDDEASEENHQRNVRSYKDKMQFNLDSWGSKKKKNAFK